MPRATATTVLLSWAVAGDGRRVGIAELDPAARRARGPFRCIGCREELVAKLGPVRARHFAHRPGSTCPLTRPETVLHLDAKERLLALCDDAFAGRRRVRLLARCPQCRREAVIDLASAGDAAQAEAALGTLRCDVLVTRGGAAALAIEVRVTHAIDRAKEAALAAAGVPALELDAREEWLREDEGGAAVVPARGFGIERCGACRTAERADEGRALGGEAARIAELESYRARGLLAPRPGAPLGSPARLTRGDVDRLGFSCPDCGGEQVTVGRQLASHRCGGEARPIAWRGYDGALVALAWWRR